MPEKKLLQDLPLTDANKQKYPNHLFNTQTNRLIVIPKRVNNVLEKMNVDSDEGFYSADIFAMAMKYRRASDVSESVRYWKESDLNLYPRDPVTKAFSKFLRSTLLSPLMKNYFTATEIDLVVEFFAKCPHDFQFSYDNLVQAHAELKPIIT
jgi:hypothetical protein